MFKNTSFQDLNKKITKINLQNTLIQATKPRRNKYFIPKIGLSCHFLLWQSGANSATLHSKMCHIIKSSCYYLCYEWNIHEND